MCPYITSKFCLCPFSYLSSGPRILMLCAGISFCSKGSSSKSRASGSPGILITNKRPSKWPSRLFERSQESKHGSYKGHKKYRFTEMNLSGYLHLSHCLSLAHLSTGFPPHPSKSIQKRPMSPLECVSLVGGCFRDLPFPILFFACERSSGCYANRSRF